MEKKRLSGNSIFGPCHQAASPISLSHKKRETFHLDHSFGWRKHALILTTVALEDLQKEGGTDWGWHQYGHEASQDTCTQICEPKQLDKAAGNQRGTKGPEVLMYNK